MLCSPQGLGEMMPEQLWDTTLDPAKRMLRRLTLRDAVEAAQLFSLLMGSQVLPGQPSWAQSCSAACVAHH